MKIYIVKISVSWLAAVCLCVSFASLPAQQTPASPETPAGKETKAKSARSAKAARRADADAEPKRSELAPASRDVSYGPDASNRIDFWKANSTTPTPLVVFIHGGGFRRGDKK